MTFGTLLSTTTTPLPNLHQHLGGVDHATPRHINAVGSPLLVVPTRRVQTVQAPPLAGPVLIPALNHPLVNRDSPVAGGVDSPAVVTPTARVALTPVVKRVRQTVAPPGLRPRVAIGHPTVTIGTKPLKDLSLLPRLLHLSNL